MAFGKVRIGISGWTYAPWRGTFYPARLSRKKELAYVAGLFPSIEINGTFYGLQRPAAFGLWRSQTPGDFVFAVKGSRYITHREHKVALVCAGSVERPLLGDLTPDFVYCRLHGSEQLYVSGNDAAMLDPWAARVRTWARGGDPDDLEHSLPVAMPTKGRDVFVYFDNDAKVRAPVDALCHSRNW